MSVDERALKDISFPPPLDKDPDFLQARKKATSAYQVSKATEFAYGNERMKLYLYPK